MRLELPLPAGLLCPRRLDAECRRRAGSSCPSRCGASDGHHEPYYFELTLEQRRNPRWHPDYFPTWEAFFVDQRERTLARNEKDGLPPPNFNEAGRRLWWSRCGASDGHHEPYYFELTLEQRRNPRWHPDYFPTWEAFFVDQRERTLARNEKDGLPPPNFNEAGRRLWWRGRTLQSVMAYDTAADSNPHLRYPQV